MNNTNSPSSRSALRRLITVLGIVIGVLVYAWGWQTTDISLEETQNPTRQASVQRALRELLSPNIFDQDFDSAFADANFLMECSDELPEQPPVADGQPFVLITPACGTRGDTVTLEIFNFAANAPGVLRWIPPSGNARPLIPVGYESSDMTLDASGSLKVEVPVPSIRGSEGEIHRIEAESRVPTGSPYFSSTTRVVIEKIVETIFLALMATTVAVPISFAISFLAARNLMKQVTMPLGSVLVGFVLLPVGWLLGAVILGQVGQVGVRLGRDQQLLGIIVPLVIIVAYTYIASAASRLQLSGGLALRLRSIVMGFLLLAVMIFVLGAIGGLMIWIGQELVDIGKPLAESVEFAPNVTGVLVSALGNFLSTLGSLVDYGIALLAGLLTAFWAASTGMSASAGVLKSLGLIPNYVGGGVLGLLSGAFLMIGVALIGTQGALLTLLAPIVAAVLAGQVASQIYERWFNPSHIKTNTSSTISWVLFGVVAVLAFFVAFNMLGITRSVINGQLPPAIPWLHIGDMVISEYIGTAGLIGAVLGALGGLLVGTRSTFPLGMVVYNTTRTILNALRAIEPLIMGIVFVIWVGIGPFAGVLALTLHSIAALGKLYSEQIESIDEGPVEAITATGATRLQMIIYGVVPQIIPPYIAFTMYRWDINVRMSTIIGFVGGGGIGFLLQQQINLLRYKEAGVAVLAIAIVVTVLDYASATIRERLI